MNVEITKQRMAEYFEAIQPYIKLKCKIYSLSVPKISYVKVNGITTKYNFSEAQKSIISNCDEKIKASKKVCSNCEM